MPNRQKRIKLAIVSGILFAGIIVAMIFFSRPVASPSSSENTPTPTSIASQSAQSITYQGKEGVDALTLLEEEWEVERTSAGFVTAINGRKADDAKKEYWSFYVNGEPSQVGAAEYQTKNTDTIEWRIETY